MSAILLRLSGVVCRGRGMEICAGQQVRQVLKVSESCRACRVRITAVNDMKLIHPGSSIPESMLLFALLFVHALVHASRSQSSGGAACPFGLHRSIPRGAEPQTPETFRAMFGVEANVQSGHQPWVGTFHSRSEEDECERSLRTTGSPWSETPSTRERVALAGLQHLRPRRPLAVELSACSACRAPRAWFQGTDLGA